MSSNNGTNSEVALFYRIAISITSVLSIFGATFIILSYIAFPKIRTRARLLLVNLSIADLVLALSSLIGTLVYYGNARLQEATQDSDKLQQLCAAQAAFNVFGALSTIFWTVAVAIYLCVLVVSNKRTWMRMLVAVLYAVCWGVPGVLTIWLGVSDHLGLDQGVTNGFCAIIPGANSSGPYIIVVGYDMWLYLAFILLPSIYFILHCKLQLCTLERCCSLSRRSVLTGDHKLAFVPLIFLFLRVWSIVVDVSIYYLTKDGADRYRNSTASVVIGVLEGIGLAGQGFANGVLFCLLTKAVRRQIAAGLVCGWCRCWSGHKTRTTMLSEAHNDESEPINKSNRRDPPVEGQIETSLVCGWCQFWSGHKGGATILSKESNDGSNIIKSPGCDLSNPEIESSTNSTYCAPV